MANFEDARPATADTGMSDTKKQQPVRLRRIVDQAGGLGGLLTRAHALRELEARLSDALPAELRDGWRLGRVDAEVLVVVVDSPGRASRLRFAQSALLRATQQALGLRPRAVRIKVVAPPAVPRKTAPPRLSSETGRLLESAASGMADERLARSLRRLARHAGKHEQ